MLDRVFVCRYTAKSVLGNVWRFVGMGDDLERLYDLAQLYDLYGALLTGKQRECLHLHIAEGFSLAEIGETLGITRQAAHESIRRAEHALAEMEERLGLRARRAAEERELAGIYEELCALKEPIATADVQHIIAPLRRYVETSAEQEEVSL